MSMEIKVLGLDRHKNVAGLNQLMGSQSSPVDNWISTSITDINKKQKPSHIHFHSKRSHTITIKLTWVFGKMF